METNAFIGVDVGKSHLDLSLWVNKMEVSSLRVENKPSRIRMGILDLLAKAGLDWSQCVFCLEHTGIYGAHIIRYLAIQNCRLYVVDPTHMKRSFGVVRGKNDRIDAARIARFIMKSWEDLLPYNCNPELKHLQALLTRRSQLISMRSQLKVPMIDHKLFSDKATVALLKKSSVPVETALDQSIKFIDETIQQCIKSKSFSEMYKRVVSVPGVGPVLAAHLIVITNGFTRLTDPRKLACYAGVAPFEHSSGSSIRGRTRVSHFANKKIKSLLHMAALTVIRLRGELADYYMRKKEEGKHAMSILNAIRNKIIHRICAVIRQEKNYSKTLTSS